MNRLLLLLGMLLTSTAYAQTKMASPALVKLIEGITSKTFTPDTTVAGLSDEAIAVVTKEPIANWSLPQTPSPQLSYQNLIVGKQSYRLVVVKTRRRLYPWRPYCITPPLRTNQRSWRGERFNRRKSSGCVAWTSWSGWARSGLFASTVSSCPNGHSVAQTRADGPVHVW